ncbi:hypothetical protein Tco_0979297, partial [Tanacetum coccineum]
YTEQPESNNGGEVDQNDDQCYDTRPLPAKLTDNMTTELSDQSLESENTLSVESLEKEIDELESEKADFSNIYDLLLEEFAQQDLPQIRKQAVQNTNVIAPGPFRNNLNHVSFQSPKEFVGSNDMVHNYYLEKAKKSANHDECVLEYLSKLNPRASA